jgi:UDP-glucose 6-dehydrogenase
MRITVIGTGYLGAVHAACMAEIGHEVLGVDVDEATIAALADGRPPFFEPGLPELLARAVGNGSAYPALDYALEPAKACEGRTSCCTSPSGGSIVSSTRPPWPR